MRWRPMIAIGGVAAVLLAGGGTTSASAYDGYADVPLCNMNATGTYAPCVQTERTTPDESWGEGFKVTFSWTDPDDWRGIPYERCVLEYYNPQTQYSAESMAPVQIDVPADWGSYTFPLTQYGWLMDGIAAGATSVKTETYCYSSGIGASLRTNGTADLVPDVVRGAAVDATATPTDDAGLAVSARSSMLASAASGAGALYSVAVTGTGGGEAASADFATPPAVRTATTAIRMSSMAVSGGSTTVLAAKASTVLSGLRPGRYTVLVSARGLLGAVTAPARTTVTIPQLTAPAVRAVAAHTSARVSWKVPVALDGGRITGFRITVKVGTHTVLHRAVKASAHSLRLTHLRARTAYDVTVRATDSKHHTSRSIVDFATKR